MIDDLVNWKLVTLSDIPYNGGKPIILDICLKASVKVQLSQSSRNSQSASHPNQIGQKFKEGNAFTAVYWLEIEVSFFCFLVWFL